MQAVYRKVLKRKITWIITAAVLVAGALVLIDYWLKFLIFSNLVPAALNHRNLQKRVKNAI